MQKLINVLALASFGVSAAVVGAGVYVYVNRDALVDAAIEVATDAALGALPIPEIPGIGGDALGLDAVPAPTGGRTGIPRLTMPM